MHCPFCSSEDSQVKDSRPADEGAAIRRRRACSECGARFTTFERVQLRDLIVIKSGGRREDFNRDKIIRAMSTALRKRPVDEHKIEQAVNSIVRQLETTGEHEIPSNIIGGLVMKALTQLDVVGYIRFASVYKDFRAPDDFNEFLSEIEELQVKKKDAAE